MKKLNQIWKVMRDLRGIAIFFVVFAHCSIRILIARNIESDLLPNSYVFPNEFWIIFHDLSSFCVPLFFFLAGNFLGNLPDSSKVIWKGLRKLLYPYLFWSICYFVMTWIKGYGGLSVLDFLSRLIKGNISIYWFIFLLMQYYLVAKWLSAAVRKWPWRSLIFAFMVQMGIMIWNYSSWFTFLESKGAGGTSDLFFSLSFAPNFVFYVVAGMWARQYPDQIKTVLQNKQARIVIIGMFIVGIVFVTNEILWMYHELYLTLNMDLISSLLIVFAQWKISIFLCSVSTILMLLLLGQLWLPSSKALLQLGTYAYTIYLTHMFLADPIYSILKHVYPSLLVNVGGFLIYLVLMLTAPILFAKFVKRFLPRFSIFLLGD